MQENIVVEWPAVLAHIARSGLSNQSALARAAGIDQSTVSRIASGEVKDPRASVAFRLLLLAGARIEMPDLPATSQAPRGAVAV